MKTNPGNQKPYSLFIYLVGITIFLLSSCTASPSTPSPPQFTEIPSESSSPSLATSITPIEWTPVTEPARYHRSPAPLIPRAQSDQTAFLEDGIGLLTGDYKVEFDGQKFLIIPPTGNNALSLTLPGGDALNMLAASSNILVQERVLEQEGVPSQSLGKQIILTGKNDWAEFQAILFTYKFHPGLLRWRLELRRHGIPPTSPQPELRFVDQTTGDEVSALLETYADKAPMAAPHLYAYSEALDSTLFYWVDLTALNPFMEDSHYTPSATPRRKGQQLGHNISRNDLLRQQEGEITAVYDSYLYLTHGQPADEDAMFELYLHNLGDIYDLIAVPNDPLPAWFDVTHWNGSGVPDGIHQGTIRDIANEQNWVTLDGKRYLRAYVNDTRQSAEAISQLDVYSALARYQLRFNEAPMYFDELRATIPDFFNPDFGPSGMFQNSGPMTITGPQGRGDVWYELGHALKVTELALWYPDDAELRDLAIRSGDTWIDFAHTVDYLFPRFYSFETWQGTGMQPDSGGGFAYFMLLLHDLTGKDTYIDEARKALRALDGYGFRLSYETHMTAITAAAAARLYQIEEDGLYLNIINRAVANILRLSWIWECDYGSLVESEDVPPFSSEWWQGAVRNRTFFGLNPTQQSAVITPKEQYETWIYLLETLQRAHGALDPTTEKLIAEFVKHTLFTIPRSLPVFMSPESMATHPAAYETVSENDLTLMIPLEDLHDGWDINGAIGQEVYGAGMAPAMAALALVEIKPGMVVYSGYPPVSIAGEMVTFAGIAGSYSPVIVIGVNSILDVAGNPVSTEICGTAICFMAEGGQTYVFTESH